MRRSWLLKLLGAGGVLGSLVIAGVLYSSGGEGDPEQRYLTNKVERGTIHRTVNSTGTLEAVVTVQVGSQVSGRIKKLYADFNSVVKKGQLLAVIDPATFEARREKALASLAIARASVRDAEAALVTRQAELHAAKASLEVATVGKRQSSRLLTRYERLFGDRLITEQDVEDAQSKLEESQARIRQGEALVGQAEAAITAADAQREQALANVQQAEAELNMASIDLAYTGITSPIDGVVIERNVDIGQTVAAALQAPTLFLIANDLTRMRVVAQVDEADIGAIFEQAQAEFSVDAFQEEIFHGVISEIRLGSSSSEGSNASNATVYNVIVEVENPLLKLRPGMTALVDFTVATSENTLKVPNLALRYTPTGISSERTEHPESPLPYEVSQVRNGGEQLQPVTLYTSTGNYGITPGPKVHFPEAHESFSEWGIVWI
jgi:HlyD family secretion protein